MTVVELAKGTNGKGRCKVKGGVWGEMEGVARVNKKNR